MSALGDRLLTRIFFVSTRMVDGTIRAAAGAFEGIWLGLLDARKVALIDEAYFQRQRMYLSESYNRQGLWHWERQSVDTFFESGSKVAVTAAGAGREVLALLDLGHDAIGFECNDKLAEFGNDLTIVSGHGLRIHESDRDVWPKLAVGFESAIVGWGSYMHIVGRRSRVAFLREAHAALPDGAPILLSFFVRRGTSIRFRVVVGVGNLLRRLRRRELLEPGDALSPLFAHSFTKNEIASELDEAGFELAYYATDPYGHAVGRARVR